VERYGVDFILDETAKRDIVDAGGDTALLNTISKSKK
jgi:hypothetical protein